MRSKLFVPATRPALLAKALAGEADAVCLDLEDGVAQTEKAAARASATGLLHALEPGHGKTLMVRINGVNTPDFERDLDAIVLAGVDMINLPNVESPDEIAHLAQLVSRLQVQRGLPAPIGLIANIESPLGLRHAEAIAGAHTTVAGLQIGFGDLFEPLGIDRRDTAATAYVQMQVRLAAGLHGVAAYDAAYADISDLAGFQAQAEAARRLGFAGKTCIHPSQVAAANRAFQATAAELEFARQVVDAWQGATQSGVGAITVAGKMIDKPFAERAAAILAQG